MRTLLLMAISTLSSIGLARSTPNGTFDNNAVPFIPAVFTKNSGQLDASILCYLKTKGAQVFFGKEKITYQFLHNEGSTENFSTNGMENKIKVHNIGLSFINRNPDFEYVELDELTSKSNFFTGGDQNKWVSAANNFKTLLYKNLYSNIDLKYYSLRDKIKYDFIVKPGGDISDINMKYAGLEFLSLSRDGELIFHCGTQTFKENIPLAYQVINGKTVNVNVKYILAGKDVVKFTTDHYNKSYPLIIDPALIYSTYIGGSSDDFFNLGDMVKDNQGNIYITGRTLSTNFPVTPGAYDQSANGNMDGFALKLNSTGSTLIYSTYFGGNNYDYGYALDIDRTTNELYIAGGTMSSNFPTTIGAYQTVYQGGPSDVVVLRLSANGSNLIYSTLIGGAGDNLPHGIALDASDNAYITGESKISGMPIVSGAYQPNHGGGSWDGFVCKLNPSGSTLIRSTYLGGANDDRSTGIALDQNSNVYICSWAGSGFPTTTGAFDQTFNGGANDVGVSKLDSTLSTLIYSTYLGGTGDDNSKTSIDVDISGQVFVTGKASAGFPTTIGAYSTTFAGGTCDAFVTKLNSSGSSLIYSTFLGSSGDDEAYNIAHNSSGEVFVTGYCSTGFPVTGCAYDQSYNGGTGDVFICRLNAAGTTLLYSTYFGGSGYDRGSAIVADGDTVYVAGETSSSNMPVTSGAFDQSYNGGTNDVFILKMDISVIDANFTYSPACDGQPIVFTNTSTGASTYSWNFGDNTSSTQSNPSHLYTTSGTYQVVLYASGTCGTDSIVQNITVSAPPNVSVTAGNNQVCSGSSTTLSAIGATTYSWSPSTGLNSTTGANVIATPSVLTTYTVTGYNPGGCNDTATVTLTVLTGPSLDIGTPQLTICRGDSAQINTSSPGSTFSWIPNYGLSNYSIPTPIAFPTVTTTYTVIVTGTNGCTNSATIPVTVNPLPPVPTIMQNGNVLASSASTGNQWFLNGNPINGATNQFYTATQNGFYQVQVTDVNGCTNISAPYNFVLAGLSNYLSTPVEVYPNPSKGVFNIDLTQFSEKPLSLEIYNALGEIIYSLKGGDLKGVLHVDITGFARGFYFLRINTPNEIMSCKLIYD